ncbi:VWA-like domain-containing protein [Clostridium tarantellae]|uniref:Peptidase n=1 Tax=Clostridium tarantellae TaxID=39493 RepID=A0A6I1MPG7_9CLOT|nr:VWA-like domain-containing protein [Clostridium tarantellae]MPQ44820.1 hypothetical protein [Clostridium tarantellae]
MEFEENGRKLYNKALEISKEKHISEDFKRQFWLLIEKAIISLYNYENSFFGQFLIQVKREINFNINWPLATKPEMGQFIMYFNPVILLECNLKEIQALLKHEVYHIIMSHYEREKALRNKYSKLAISIAMDIAINQYIKDLPSYAKRIGTINLQYNLELKAGMPMEKYAEEIQKAIDFKNSKKIDKKVLEDENEKINQENAHDIWSSSLLTIDNLNGITKKTSLNAYKGKAPKDIEKIIFLMKEEPEIEWKKFLSNLLPTTRSGYKKTITRKDRRLPNRLDLRGKLPNTIPKILIAIDISASMSDKDIENIMVEILALVKNKNTEIKVIECDDQIRKVYNLHSIKDIKPRSKKNGSTKFSPVFKYIKENNMRDHILVYFTDGVGEKTLEVKPINNRTLWVLTGDEELSLDKPYGTIKRIFKEKKEVYGHNYGLQELRENLHDWAR